MYHRSLFGRFARTVSSLTGHPLAFGSAALIVMLWAVMGPVFGFSNTWQLVVNTGTTIITFLMVFLIQNTQNRDSTAMHLKLDELIRSIDGAHNALLDLEELEVKQLQKIRGRYQALAAEAREDLSDLVRLGSPSVDLDTPLEPPGSSRDESGRQGS